MNSMLITSWYDSFSLVAGQMLAQTMLYFPRIVAALLVLLFGSILAKIIKRLAVKLLEALRLSSLVKNTPIEHFLTNADMEHKFEEVLGSIFYWLIMLVVLNTSVSILGLEPISAVLAKVLNYLPNILSAILVLFFGVLLAGVVESVVKGSIKSMDGKSSRVFGKVSSYLVMSIAVLAAISELGIASEFIMILFIGFVTMLSLGVGLALGLGGQDLVRVVLQKWYERTSNEVRE